MELGHLLIKPKVLKKFKKYDIIIDTEPYLNISAILGWLLGRNVIGFRGLFRNKLYDFKIEYNDNTKGFDTQKIKDAFQKRYHGRGIKIVKHLSHGMFFNHNGTAIKIFLKV